MTCLPAIKNPLPSKAPQKCLCFLFLSLSLCLISLAALLYFLSNWERNFIFNNLQNREKQLLFIDCFVNVMGLRTHLTERTPPLHTIKFIFVIVFFLCRPLLCTIIFTSFYTKIFDKTVTYPKLWDRYKKLMAFLTDENTTTSLLFSATRYMKLRWSENEGQYEPELMKNLPYHLRAAVINYSYGKYLFFNMVFNGCSVNFLRQIAVYIKSTILYSKDVIVISGSHERCVYFIKSGCVIVNDKKKQCTVDVLYKWDSFGLVEGLRWNQRFECDYVAYSRVHLLCLYFKDWEHLIPFFLEDFKILNNNLKSMNENVA